MNNKELNAEKHYLVLDGMRGVVALAVVIFHIRAMYLHYSWPADTLILRHAHLAVDLFFLMSGLVVARAYERKILSGNMGFWDFCRVRLIRLYPLYCFANVAGYSYLSLRALLQHDFHLKSLGAFGLNTLFIPNFPTRQEAMFPYNGAAWSLSWEMAINIAYAAIGARLPTKLLTTICAVSALALVFGGLRYGTIDLGWSKSNFYTGGLVRTAFSFTLGVIFHRLIASGKLKAPSLSPCPLLAICALLILTPCWKAGVYYDFACVFLGFPALIILGCFAKPCRLDKAFWFLGAISYPLYITHNATMFWFGGIWKVLADIDYLENIQVSGPLLLGCIFLVSFIVWRIDERVRKWLSQKTWGGSRPLQ